MFLSWVPLLSLFKGSSQGVTGGGSVSTFLMWLLVASGPLWLGIRDINSLHMGLSLRQLTT